VWPYTVMRRPIYYRLKLKTGSGVLRIGREHLDMLRSAFGDRRTGDNNNTELCLGMSNDNMTLISGTTLSKYIITKC